MKGKIYENKGPRGARWIVRFDTVFKRFNNFGKAERFLTGLRFQYDNDTFDARDWQRSQPLGFESLSGAWLDYRKDGVRCFRNLRGHIQKAQFFFGNKNIKSVDYANLEDFLFALQAQGLSSKTQKNVFTTLHSLWVWCKKRYGVEIPEFPQIKVTLGWRTTIDKGTQLAVLDEIKRISWHINPKIYIGVKWLSTYYEVRPTEMINVREKDFNYEANTLFIENTKTGDSRIVFMLDEDMRLARTFGPAFPELCFFRHIKGNGACHAGQRFGRNYLWKWWTKARQNLGIEGVDLYGGTRHSTVRHLAEQYTPEQIKHGGWQTNKAFDRYLGPVQQGQKRAMYERARACTVCETKKRAYSNR